MSLHPDVQRLAQAEIERVVGRDRLLSIDDQTSLPYVTAVLKETLRWAPVAPLGPYCRRLPPCISSDMY
jgi:cytochrome P450